MSSTAISTPSIRIRDALPSDAPAIAAIYDHYVQHTPITFEIAPAPSSKDMANRIAKAQILHAWLVAEDVSSSSETNIAGGESAPKILGYAHGSQMNARAAYRWSAYTGIYLCPTATGRGVGRALYEALIERLEKRGYRQLFGIVSQPNDVSNRMHERLGFERCSILKRSGFKMGKWWDVWWFQKSIGEVEGDEEPAEIR